MKKRGRQEDSEGEEQMPPTKVRRTEVGFSADVLASFAQTSSGWQCKTCLVFNRDGTDQCMCCEANRPGSRRQSAPAGFSFDSGVGEPKSSKKGRMSLAPTSTGGGFSFGDASPAPGGGFTFAGASSGGGFQFGGASSAGFVFNSNASNPIIEEENEDESEEEAPKPMIVEEDAPGSLEKIDILERLSSKKVKEGAVYVVGSGECSQLGLGDDFYEAEAFTMVGQLLRKSICKIASGALHVLALSVDGDVFSWGCNDDGALGRPGDENVPVKLSKFSSAPIKSICCGDCHSVAVDEEGSVYVWGTYKGAGGYIGMSQSRSIHRTPHKLLSGDGEYGPVVEVACGDHHTLALTASQELLSWGCGEQGQLGRASRVFSLRGGKWRGNKVILEPNSVTKLPGKVAGIACGAFHSLAIVEGGAVWSWGLNNYGQLGLGHKHNEEFPTPVPALKEGIASVRGGAVLLRGRSPVAGYHHSFALTNSGTLFAFGRGDSGQLGDGKGHIVAHCREEPWKLEALADRVVEVQCPGNHTLIVTVDDRLFSCGYGDRLQLGNGEEKDVDVPHCVWTGRERGKLLQVDGGAQHTVVLVEK